MLADRELMLYINQYGVISVVFGCQVVASMKSSI